MPATRHAEHAAQALLNLRRRRAGHVLLSRDDRDGEALAMVEPGHAVRSTMPMGELIDTLSTERIRFEASSGAKGEYWAEAPRHLDSLERLCWLFGERFAREQGLLPWLSMRKPYRLLAWPDFGEVGSDVHGAALCGLLSHEALSPRDAALRLAWPEPMAVALFNAVELCGALVPAARFGPGPREASAVRARTVGTPAQHMFFTALWRRLTR